MPAFTEHVRMLGYLCVRVNVWTCRMTDCKLISYLRSLPAWMLLSHAWLHVLCLCLCSCWCLWLALFLRGQCVY